MCKYGGVQPSETLGMDIDMRRWYHREVANTIKAEVAAIKGSMKRG